MTDNTVLDVFCGAGGFSEGFKQEGFQIICGLDSWQPAIETYNYNFKLDCSPQNVREIASSVEAIETLPDTSIIIGSPPCVSFSSSNRSGKADKTLGVALIEDFLRIITVKKYKTESKLKAWVMENVGNSSSHIKDFYTFHDLSLETWAIDIGFDPDGIALLMENKSLKINAADFGVPQARKRVFYSEIVATSNKATPHNSINPNKDKKKGQLTLGYVLSNLPSPNSKKSKRLITDPLYPGITIKQSDLVDQFYDTGLYACEWEGSRYLKTNHPYMGHMYFPERLDRPSRTVTATKIGTSREAIILRSEREKQGDGEYRTPTVREAGSLMGFPITYQFIGTEGNKWKLVGNAVCPPVSRAFAHKIANTLGIPSADCISNTIDGTKVPNLNTYMEKVFDNPPKRKPGSKFRRHPIKMGNMTVTLSNYDIQGNPEKNGIWQTSIQYGTGEGFLYQNVDDGFYQTIESIIAEFQDGTSFIDSINNGFSGNVASADTLQCLYENRMDLNNYMRPERLIEIVHDLVQGTDFEEPLFNDESLELFLKKTVPKKQIMALYAINKICTIANGG